MKVLIADDEPAVLEGLQYVVDWENLGFSFLITAKNGEEALEKILNSSPDLVVLDIRMPKLTGIDVIKLSKENGYKGHFILLSGFSDFTYAQIAIKYGVDFYLTKPIDEDELENTVKIVKNIIEKEKKDYLKFNQYKDNAKHHILRNIIKGKLKDFSNIDLKDLHLFTDSYQIVIYERYNKKDLYQDIWDFGKIFSLPNNENNFDYLTINNLDIILLKGNLSIEKFKILTQYSTSSQKVTPLEAVFLAIGKIVYKIEDIHISFNNAYELLNRRFFCYPNQYFLDNESLPEKSKIINFIDDNTATYYADKFIDYIQSQNIIYIQETINEIKVKLFFTNHNIDCIKHFLIEIYLQVKEKISHKYFRLEIPFPTNSSIISLIESRYYLYEILEILLTDFKMCINALGSPTNENIMNNILHYIKHNFNENLKLENIATLFGYNSAYLGKVFKSKVGESFNSYLDLVRIENSKKMLKEENLKVYEIAEKVGYNNVDYFHKKFKKYVGISPAEYRKSNFLSTI